MAKRPIVARQVIAQVIGPNGPVDCGKWESGECTLATETLDYKPTDGSTVRLVEGSDYSGTVSRGEFDAKLAQLIWDQQHPGTSDPPRLLLLFSKVYNEDPTTVFVFKEVLLRNLGSSWGRGRVTAERLDWVAEDLEIV